MAYMAFDNTPSYSTLLVIFAIIISSDFDQASAERGGAMNHGGIWPVECLLAFLTPLCFLFSIRFFFNSRLPLASPNRSSSLIFFILDVTEAWWCDPCTFIRRNYYWVVSDHETSRHQVCSHALFFCLVLSISVFSGLILMIEAEL